MNFNNELLVAVMEAKRIHGNGPVKIAKGISSTFHPKTYRIMHNIGKVKYVVSYHDGKSTHNDGSKFFDIRTASNKVKLKQITDSLKSSGYVES